MMGFAVQRTERGFSLVELAMVLFIISLLLGGLLVPLASQLEARQRNETKEQLNRIREALIGFVVINGRLPCYTTEPDPANANYGIEDSPCNPTGLQFAGNDPCDDLDGDGVSDVPCDGILPWKTLGLETGRDPWGVERSEATDRWLGYWRYRVDSNFRSTISLSSDFTGPSEQLGIVDSSGNDLSSTSENPIAIVYSTGANRVENGANSSYEATAGDDPTYQGGPVSGDFDDIITWITRPLLFNRMVTAGTLP